MTKQVHWVQLDEDKRVVGEGFTPLEYNDDAISIDEIWDGWPYIDRVLSADGTWPAYVLPEQSADEIEEERLIGMNPDDYTLSDQKKLERLLLQRMKQG